MGKDDKHEVKDMCGDQGVGDGTDVGGVVDDVLMVLSAMMLQPVMMSMSMMLVM